MYRDGKCGCGEQWDMIRYWSQMLPSIHVKCNNAYNTFAYVHSNIYWCNRPRDDHPGTYILLLVTLDCQVYIPNLNCMTQI